MNVLLVVPRDPYLDDDRVMPPLGVMALRSYLESMDIPADIENDFDFENVEQYDFYTHIGISCVTPQSSEAHRILRVVKESLPETKVILGGPHAKFYLNEAMQHPYDHIVVGDGELALRKILLRPDQCSKVVHFPVSEYEMNRFPVPYRDPEFLNEYEYPMLGWIKTTTMVTAKGCPMSCAFCEHAREPVRLYDANNVRSQLEDISVAGFGGVMFFDDIFTLSMRRVKDLAPVVGDSGLSYRCFGHANTMTPKMAKMLSETGCVEIGFGAESGSQKILDAVDKKTTVEKNKRFVRICNDHGIRVKAFLIAGLPGESKKTLLETEQFLEFLMGRGENDFDMTVYYPYKGTRIRDSIDRGESVYDLSLSDGDATKGFYKGVGGEAEAMVKTSFLSAMEIKKAQSDFLEKYK